MGQWLTRLLWRALGRRYTRVVLYAQGDLSARVPLISTDEVGRLAASFNGAVRGLGERERLREAFGAFVDPVLADRVLEEGTTLPGEEVDGVLGVFGAPERHSDHADRAVAAAREIAVLVRERHGDGLRVGIGLNSGSVVAGTVGGGGRLEFAVIGDAVNTAARVERATRDARHRRRRRAHSERIRSR
ncbi:MAG: adenylate/guanylate cyclase domain-containing protein [Solirubrobacteraceae bacterium MAG38_C4-C5]|nr:adenylate/guanylate cyclase domain-containing protein [Candidatus Siliceabacter maunaloa]